MSMVMYRLFHAARNYTVQSFNSQLKLKGLKKASNEKISAFYSQFRNYSTVGANIKDSSTDGKNATLVWDNGNISRFHSKWLRFNCQCPVCVESYSNQVRIDVEKVPLQMTLKDIDVSDNGMVEVTWNEDRHKGSFTTDFLQANCYSKERINKIRKQSKPKIFDDLTVPRISWTDVEKSDKKLYEWLCHINVEGLCILTDVPTEKNYVIKVMKKIGYPVRDFYGEIFDIYSRDKALNLSFSSDALKFHMDYSWNESPSGVQFLHCLRFDESITGGYTLIVDMFHVVEEFRKKYPYEFNTLCRVPATFWRINYNREDPVHYIHRKPIISVNEEDEVISIAWHAHAAGPPLVNEENVEDFYTAYQQFARMMNGFPYIREVRLQEGELIVFNNRRFAHGRSPMECANGTRHLQGGHVSVDDYKSKLLVLSKKYNPGGPTYSVMNSNWI